MSANSPTPAEVRAAREAAGLSHAEAAEMVHVNRVTWSRWEAEGRADSRQMHAAFWELFQRKVREKKLAVQTMHNVE